VIAPSDLLTADDSGNGTAGARTARQIMRPGPLVTYPDEILRAAADRMAEHWIGALPVISRDTRRLLGILTEFDLLKARQRHLTEERHQERVLRIRRLNPPPPAQRNAHGSTPPGNAATPPPDARTPAAAPAAQEDGTHDTRRPDQAATFRPAGDSPGQQSGNL
jgi:CBS domain-containing protein